MELPFTRAAPILYLNVLRLACLLAIRIDIEVVSLMLFGNGKDIQALSITVLVLLVLLGLLVPLPVEIDLSQLVVLFVLDCVLIPGHTIGLEEHVIELGDDFTHHLRVEVRYVHFILP